MTLRVKFQVLFDDKLRKLIKRMSKAEQTAFLETQRKTLVAQARSNITRMGRLGSTEWPALSSPYARRKSQGKTPGRGAHKVTMLKDTGALNNSLVAYVVPGRSGPRLVLDAVGGKKGITHAELLLVHAEGRGDMPERNPVHLDKMKLFLKRFEAALGKWLIPA
jgi:hypothetical protein